MGTGDLPPPVCFLYQKATSRLFQPPIFDGTDGRIALTSGACHGIIASEHECERRICKAHVLHSSFFVQVYSAHTGPFGADHLPTIDGTPSLSSL